MPLYLLERSDDPANENMGVADMVHSFIIRAINETEARSLASAEAQDEGAQFWFNTLRSTCKRLSDSGDTEILLKGIR